MSGTPCYFTGCKWTSVGRCNYRVDHFGVECGAQMCPSHVKQATYVATEDVAVWAIDPDKPAHCLQHEPPHNQARML